jgi:uncharacterized protein YkwD
MDGRRRVVVLLTAVIATLAISAPPAQAAECNGANVLPVLAGFPTAQAATLCLLNAERSTRGLPALATQPALEAAATAHSQAMVQQRFFAHVSPGGQTIKQRLSSYIASVANWAMGENLAWGEGALATPAAIVKGWMESPGHRVNILSATFEEIGIGIVGGTPVGSLPANSATYTTAFGARGASPSSAGATATSAALPGATTPAKRISAKKRAQISRRCHRVANRTKASKKTRKARYSRCMRTQLRAARR